MPQCEHQHQGPLVSHWCTSLFTFEAGPGTDVRIIGLLLVFKDGQAS